MISLTCTLLIWNDEYVSALSGVIFNDLAPNKYALSIIKCEWKSIGIINDAKTYH